MTGSLNIKLGSSGGGGSSTWGDLTGIPAAITTLSSATAAGLALMDDANASAQRTTLGLGTLATQSGTFSGTSSGTNSGDITITDTDTFDFGLTSQALTGSVRLQMSLTSDASGIKLSGDSASPGNSKVYGTDGSGTKGWYAASSGSGDMTKAVYDPRGLNIITGLPGTNDGAQTGGLGGQLIFVGGNAGPNAGEDGGAAGIFTASGGTGASGLPGGSGGGVFADAQGQHRGGNLNMSASSFLRGGDIYTAGGGDINTTGTGSIGLGATGTRTTLNGAASSDWTLTLPTGAGTNGQVLQTDGSGTTSWATVSSGATLAANTYTGLQQFSGTTHAGLRLNNLTTAERDALTGAAGMAIWNTTDGRLQLYNGSGWTAGMVRLDGDTMTGALTIGVASSLLLGTAGSAVGSVGFRNATSGTVTLAPPTGALGTITVTLPGVTSTLATLGANTFTGAQSVNSLSIQAGGSFSMTNLLIVNIANQRLASGMYFGFSSASDNSGVADIALYRDAAGVLALRNATTLTNPTVLRAYGTFTDASNYVRLALNTTSTTMGIACETAGTGADDIDLSLTPAGTGNVRFGTHSAVGAETVTGFITIKDSGGTSRKLAVIS